MAAAAEINVERFYNRLERLQTDWISHKNSVWGGSDAICIPLGANTDDDSLSYSKSSSMHIFLFGYEFPDSIVIITRNNFYFMATTKKCDYFNPLVGKNSAFKINLLQKTKDEGMNREHFNTLLNVVRKGGGSKLGSLYKGEYAGSFIPSWMQFVEQGQIDKVEIAPALGLFLAVKDELELVSQPVNCSSFKTNYHLMINSCVNVRITAVARPC